MPQLAAYLFTLLLVLGAIGQGHAQEEYPSEACAAANKLESIAQYDILTQAGARPRRLLIEGYFYDKAGRNTRWRQYEAHDSTKYSDRDFNYDATGKHVKMAQISADGADGIIDSVGTDANGIVTYRKLYRPSGEVLFEMWITTELNDRKQPIKTAAFNKQKQLQGYTTFTYNTAAKPVAELGFSMANELEQQTLYSYYPDGTLRKISSIKGTRDTIETKLFMPNGSLMEERRYNQEMHGALDHKIVKKYDSQQREVEEVTYSNNFFPGAKNKLVPSRREVSQYGTSCLKIKTLIYTIDTLSGKE
ncbi:MAG: hypothetical protein ACRYFZ_18435 [Janthinobacterium lividum]